MIITTCSLAMCNGRSLVLGTVSTLALTLLASTASASTFQVTTTANVTQDIALGLNPTYYHNNQGFGDPWEEGFIWFDEAVRVLNEEANVWDQSQIPNSPQNASTNVVSQAQVTGTWTFDASLLYNFDDNIKGSEDADGNLDGQLLGQTSDVSTFRVFNSGQQVDSGFATTTRVGVANDLAISNTEEWDILVIEAEFPNDPNVESDGIQLLMAFEGNWFERLNSNDFKDNQGNTLTGDDAYQAFFEGVIVSAIEYEETVFYDYDTTLPTGYFIAEGTEMFNVAVFSDVNDRNLSFNSFGAADGSSENAPLLPTTVSNSSGNNQGAAETFSFDVSGAGTDIVFVDPEIAVGYTYEVVGDGVITTFVAPSADAVAVPVGFAGYKVTVKGGALDGQEFTVMPADPNDILANALTFDESDGVKQLVLTGIWQDLELDPNDYLTFVAGFGFAGATNGTSITQTAIVIDTDAPPAVPLPAGAWLMITAFGGLAAMRRRKKS